MYPDSIYDQSYYAYYAFHCGQMDIARKQFKILGDHPDLEPWGTRKNYEKMRHEAEGQKYTSQSNAAKST